MSLPQDQEIWRLPSGHEMRICRHFKSWIDADSGNLQYKVAYHEIAKASDCTTPGDEIPPDVPVIR